MSCQLAKIPKCLEKNKWSNSLFQAGLNLLRPIKGWTLFVKKKLVDTFNLFPKLTDVHCDVSIICVGDTVRVLEKKEIKKILDPWRKYHGCSFMDQMYLYCGKEFRVLKVIDYFFDEAKQRLVKCKDLVILEGVTCNGVRTLYPERCDRNCYLFWHTAWLRRIE